MSVNIVFEGEGPFVAMNKAEAFLAECGFSFGSWQRGAPAACMFGDYSISKWSNLNHDERREIHATLSGDGRRGPLIFKMLPAAPDEAIAAVEAALSADAMLAEREKGGGA